jgi:hypothetical protein
LQEALPQLTIFARAAVITSEGGLLAVAGLLTRHTQTHPRHYLAATLWDCGATAITFESTFALGEATAGTVHLVCQAGIDLILNCTVFGKSSCHETTAPLM